MNRSMTILIWLMLLATSLLTGCEKMTDEELSATGKNVVIRVSEVDAGWEGQSTRALVPITEVCTRVCFAVYQDGSRKTYKNQKTGDSDFGSYSLSLDAGTYQLLVVGHSGAANPTTTSPSKVQFTNPSSSGGTGFTDTFYYYGTLVVGSSGTQTNISMKRATAMFRLKTNDAKPAAVKRFQFYYEGGSGALDATTGYGCVNSKQSVFVDATESGQQQFEMYTFPHEGDGGVTFTVKALGADDNILYTKEFANVKMQRNCITQYSGDFFKNGNVTPSDDKGSDDPDEPSSNVVMVNPEWGQTFEYTY